MRARRFLFSTLTPITLLALSGCEAVSPGRVNEAACPSAFYFDQYVVSLDLHATPPAKIAVYVDGLKVFDECFPPPVGGAPFYDVSRADSVLTVKANYLRNGTELPETLDLMLVDRVDCTTLEGPELLVTDDAVLQYGDVFPNGKRCGSYRSATLQYESP